MGLRMKVAVGYGLDIAGLPRDGLEFSKLEDTGRFQAFITEALSSLAGDEGLMDRMLIHMEARPIEEGRESRPRTTALYELVAYDEEFAFADKLLLFPLSCQRTWKRGWDDLDSFVYEAYREQIGLEWLESEWREKPGTLHPFTGLMRANPEMPLGVEQYWIPCYMDHPEHKDATPWAPWHLWFLIKHLGLATEPDEITRLFLSLRPTLMRWWS